MIIDAKLKNYRNAEFLEFISSTIQLVNRSGVTALNAAKVSLENEYKELEASFKVEQGSKLTATVQELDARRDDAIVGFRTLAKAYTYHYEADRKAAAFALLKTIDKYSGNIARLNYQAETAALKSLIGDFTNDADLMLAIDKLGLNEWMSELNNANLDFNAKYLDRVEDTADRQTVAVSEKRPAAMEAYQNLVKHIEANSVLNPSSALMDLINWLNELITSYNAL